jgi:hypothetical protein
MATGKACSANGLPDTPYKFKGNLRENYEGRWRGFQLEKVLPFVRAWLARSKKFSKLENTARMILLSKTGSSTVRTDQTRPIAIISPIRKLCELTWLNMYHGLIWKTIGPYQNGFRQGGSTTQSVINFIEKQRANPHWATLFIDLRGAYDTV